MLSVPRPGPQTNSHGLSRQCQERPCFFKTVGPPPPAYWLSGGEAGGKTAAVLQVSDPPKQP